MADGMGVAVGVIIGLLLVIAFELSVIAERLKR